MNDKSAVTITTCRNRCYDTALFRYSFVSLKCMSMTSKYTLIMLLFFLQQLPQQLRSHRILQQFLQ